MHQCPQCSYEFEWHFQVDHHVRRNHTLVYADELFHAIVEPELFSCIRCAFKACYNCDLYEHYDQQHRDRIDEYNIVQKSFSVKGYDICYYPCNLCQYKSHSSLCLVKHAGSCEMTARPSTGRDNAATSASHSNVVVAFGKKTKTSFRSAKCSYKAKRNGRCCETTVSMFPLYDPVCVLLENAFSRWTDADKKDFLNGGKPAPVLSVTKATKVRNKVYTRGFKIAWYTQFDWLCGSFYLNRLFCLPCLLVGAKSNVWNKTGFDDWGNVSRALHKHEGSSEHLRSALGFAKLKKNLKIHQVELEENSRLYVQRFNENVQLNRRFMLLPIRAALYLGKQELSFNDEASSNGNFNELLESYIALSPVDIQEHYKKIASEFAANSITIQNEIIECICRYVREYIDKELNECNFFAVQVDDSSSVAQKSHCSSMIVRYVNCHGKLVERFLGFHDWSSSQDAGTLFKCLEKSNYKAKLIAQCFNGASSVMAEELNGRQAQIKQVAPQAVLVHSLSHRLTLVLQQSCDGISKCRVFFATLSGLLSFFYHSKRTTRLVHTIIGRRLPDNSTILNFVHEEWDFLKQVFTEILNDSTSDQTSVRQSHELLNRFADFEFAFLVVVFDDIFRIADSLFDDLQNQSLNVDVCLRQIRTTQTLLNGRRNEANFTAVFNAAASRAAVPIQDRSNRVDLEAFDQFKSLYYEILDVVLRQIATRFQDTEKLQFVALMDASKFAWYRENFPTRALDGLKTCYPKVFADLQRVKNELQLIYGDERYRSVESWRQFLEILYENRNIFKEAYKLLCLIITIPSTGRDVSDESSFCCLKRIETYLRNTVREKERLSSLATISIEKELLDELIGTQPFFEDIINKFAGLKDRRIFDLVFKK